MSLCFQSESCTLGDTESGNFQNLSIINTVFILYPTTDFARKSVIIEGVPAYTRAELSPGAQHPESRSAPAGWALHSL